MTNGYDSINEPCVEIQIQGGGLGRILVAGALTALNVASPPACYATA